MNQKKDEILDIKKVKKLNEDFKKNFAVLDTGEVKNVGMAPYDRSILDGIMEIRASRGMTKDYAHQPAGQPQVNPAQVNVIRDMFRFDTVLSTALDTTVDVTTFNGYKFVGDNQRNIKKAEDEFERLQFSEVIDNITYQMLMYGDAFMELRRDGSGRVDEIWPLETTEMMIDYDKHGKILKYHQRPLSGGSGSDIIFDADDIIHFRLKWIGSSVYSFTPFESVARAYSTNVWASHYLNTIFRNLPPKMIYILGNADQRQIEQFQKDLQRIKTNPSLDLVLTGENADVKNTVPDLPAVLLEILRFVREQILMITRVPPVWVGLPQTSNRSNAQAQIQSFETRVRKIQQKIECNVNFNPTPNLMEALGLKKVRFKWTPVSLENEEMLTQVAERLKTIGYSPKVVDAYLRMNGFKLKMGEVPDFTPPAPQGFGGGKSEDMFESRKRENKRMPMKDNMKPSGASPDGKAKSKEQNRNRNLTS